MNNSTLSVNISFIKVITFAVAIVISTFTNAQTIQHNNDPLSLDETLKISQLMTVPTMAARSSDNAINLSNLTNTSQEVLLIERNIEKGAPSNQRRADVFIYDYSTNELIESLIDLNTSEVIRSERRQGVQLPLTENEIQRAKEIVFEDEDERAILDNEFSRITSKHLTSTDELNVKAFSFYAESLPNRANEASKSCGIHRCAQLMLYTNENVVFEVSPIVNLSEGVVTQRIGF